MDKNGVLSYLDVKIFLILASLCNCSGIDFEEESSKCLVTEQKENGAKPCVFPFKFDSKTIKGCTTHAGTALEEIQRRTGYRTQRYINSLGYRFVCGGSIINRYYVLTAAHCVDGGGAYARNPDLVFLGEYTIAEKDQRGFWKLKDPDEQGNFRTKAQKIEIEKYIVHENWNGNPANGFDIALVKLKAPITMNHDDSNVSVKPVCLPFKTNCKNLAGCRPRSTLPCPCENGPDAFETTPKNRGKEALVAGWGKTAFYKNSTQIRDQNQLSRTTGLSSETLQKLYVPVTNPRTCLQFGVSNAAAFSRFICAGGKEGKDSCQGDSGGPLLYGVGSDNREPWVQIGIVSYGSKRCAVKNLPGVYTYVPAYLDWIIGNVDTQ